MVRRIGGALGVVFFLLMSLPTIAAPPDRMDPDEATAFVESLFSRASTLADEASRSERRNYHRSVGEFIAGALDLDGLSRFTAGPAWTGATLAEQQEYRSVYAEWMVSLYERYFAQTSGGKLAVRATGAVSGSKDAYVWIQIQTGASPVIVGIQVRNTKDGPRIIDMVSSGVSLIRTQREDFGAVAQKRGLAGLVAELRTKMTPAVAEAR
jgi:ABC-type transporter MlaC component